MVEDARAKSKSRDAKRKRSFDSCSSKGRLDIKDNRRFKNRFSNHVPSKFTNACDERVSNPKPKKVRVTSSPNKKSTYVKCGKSHIVE